MNVDFKTLRWALAAAQHKSLRKAAEVLNVRQSTLSRCLRVLEGEVGAELFERNNGGTRLTPDGREFLETAKRVVEDAEGTAFRLRTRTRGESGRLVIGVHASPSMGNLRATIVEFRQRYPKIGIYLVDGCSERLVSKVHNSVIDIAFILQGSSQWDDAALTVWSERLVVALPEGHRLRDRTAIHWLDLRGEALLIPRNGPGVEFLDLIVSRLGCRDQNQPIRQDVGLDRLLMLVAAGCGILLALEGATGASYPGVLYREVHEEDGPSWRTFRALWRQSSCNPALHLYLALLKERYRDLTVPAPTAM